VGSIHRVLEVMPVIKLECPACGAKFYDDLAILWDLGAGFPTTWLRKIAPPANTKVDDTTKEKEEELCERQ
jgi:hypothetical protein